jgi:hypothetical protein
MNLSKQLMIIVLSVMFNNNNVHNGHMWYVRSKYFIFWQQDYHLKTLLQQQIVYPLQSFYMGTGSTSNTFILLEELQWEHKGVLDWDKYDNVTV